MQLGMIGLGRMGANLVRRLMRDGHECVGVRRERGRRSTELGGGGRDRRVLARGLRREARRSRARCGSWCRPRSSTTTIDELVAHLEPGDIIIDGGNSYYRDDIDRAAHAEAEGASTTSTCGTSGGVFGLDRGFCLMIGGEDDVVAHLDPIFTTIAPGVDAAPRTPGRTGDPSTAENGYLHCGPNGAGHFVKMVHNGIEYGIMAAYAEGLNILHNADVGKHAAPGRRRDRAAARPAVLPVRPRHPRGRRGVAARQRRRVVAARPHRARAVAEPDLADFEGRVSDSGEGRWTIARRDRRGRARRRAAARRCSRASRRAASADFADRLLSAMRKEFGGHDEKLDQTIGETK